MNLSVWRFGLATAITFFVLYVVCFVAVILFPDGTVDFFNSWFHGLDLKLLKPTGGRPLTVGQFIKGFVGVAVVAFPGGALLAWVYNALNRSARA